MKKIKQQAADILVRIVSKINQAYARIFVYQLRGKFKYLGSNTLIENPAFIMNPECISIGDNFTARAGVKLRAYTSFDGAVFEPVIRIGNNVHLAADCTINCLNRIEIGDRCALGAGSKLMDHMHGVPDYSDILVPVMKRVLTSRGAVTLGKNVYVGAGVVILAGVEIGDNCIIGSNSVVTRSIPANSIAAGVPARVIRTIAIAGYSDQGTISGPTNASDNIPEENIPTPPIKNRQKAKDLL